MADEADELAAAAEQPGLPVELDTTRPHQARIYDYWLGGKDNFAVDREAAERALAVYPGLRRGVRAQRAFLANVVGYLARSQGIRQFLDIGTGIPTANNTHEVAHAVDPLARVVYLDNDRCNSGCTHLRWAWSGRRADQPRMGHGGPRVVCELRKWPMT
jgi:hypothetical protein